MDFSYEYALFAERFYNSPASFVASQMYFKGRLGFRARPNGKTAALPQSFWAAAYGTVEVEGLNMGWVGFGVSETIGFSGRHMGCRVQGFAQRAHTAPVVQL